MIQEFVAELSSEPGSEWSEGELRASVRAYLDMARLHRAGLPFVKKAVYRDLAARFGRTEKSYEYRMQNISFVLSLQGRAWLPGLVPAQNVGASVAAVIERLLAEEEQGGQYGPGAAFELQVKSKMKAEPAAPPPGNDKPPTRHATSKQYDRDPEVAAWVRRNAKGKCECCEAAAPFLDSSGEPYLEVHHVQRLADGGADTIANAVAVCPNCHRQLHHGKDAIELAEQLRQRLARLAVRRDSPRTGSDCAQP